jgi:DNA recombination protein RmuC
VWLVLITAKILKLGRKTQEQQPLLLLQNQIETLRAHITQEMSNLIQNLTEQFHKNLSLMDSANKNITSQLTAANRTVQDVHERLGEVKQISERIYEIGKEIASLQQLLRAPKLRGGLGELLLEDLLAQVLPTSMYVTQYTFASGERVDAVIKFPQGIVPIDAKFPLENFRKYMEESNEDVKKELRKNFIRDVKKHIDVIAKKYINPAEGTFDFAMMYIPAENVYYETIIRHDKENDSGENIFLYALSKKVMPVSPNSFYGYLQVIVLGLKGLQVERHAREIVDSIAQLQTELRRFEEDFTIIGTHIRNAIEKYNDAFMHINKVKLRLDSIQNIKPEISLPLQQ